MKGDVPMIDNTAYKTKLKLLTFFLVVSLLPLILLGIASSAIMKKYEKNTSLSSISNICSISSEHLSERFKSIKSKVDYSAGSEDVKNGVHGLNYNAQMYLKGICESDNSILSVIVCDLEGKISETSIDAAALGLESMDVAVLENDIKNNGGFSDLTEFSAHDGSMSVLCCSRYIRNGEGAIDGIITFVYDTAKLLSSSIVTIDDGLSTMYIADWNGNSFASEKTGVTKLSEIAEFKDIKDEMQKVSSGALERNFEYEAGDQDKVLQYFNLTDTKNSTGKFWSIVCSTAVGGSVSRYKDISSSIQSTIFAISIIDIALIIMFVMMFLKPISNTMRILMVNDINVSSQRILVNGSSELDQLNRQINTLLDTLSESEQRYRYIVDMTDNIIFEYSVKKNEVIFSDNYNKKFSYRANSLKYEDSFFVNATVYPEDQSAYKNFVEAATEGQNIQDEFRFKTIYNDYVWYIMRCAAIRDSYNSIIKIVGVMIDIDKTKSREQKLMDKASLDPLTQAFNRESFELSLNNEIDLSQMRKGKDAVLFIDLDNFKHFNDEYNHAVGDEVLVYTVELSKKLVGKNGFVGRFGGDEFVICYRETDNMDASALAQRIIAGLGDGFESENCGKHIIMFCSIGISYISPEDSDPSVIIERADQAMYTVKKSGKSNYAIYKEI